MRVTACEFVWLRVPFRAPFKHAAAERTASDSVLIVLQDEAGYQGFGEVLARSYVTGETTEEVFAAGPALADVCIGRRFGTQQELVGYLTVQLESGGWQPALLGGFEAALINLFEQTVTWDFASMLGRRRTTPPGSCFTIGFEATVRELRHRAMMARVSAATVVKVKVGGADDARRLGVLSEHLGKTVPLRLDANGSLSLEQAVALLAECRGLPIQSLEQPFDAREPDLADKLRALHAQTAVPLVADESVCTPADAATWVAYGGYQVFNVRVGKCGGLLACARIMQAARAAGVCLVAGSMVGESGVLTHASEVLLAHSDDLPYVEGLGQNRSLLVCDPVEVVSSGRSADGAGRRPVTVFRLRDDARKRFLVARQRIDG